MAGLCAHPSVAQEQEGSWLPSLIAQTHEQGFDLAVSMARKAVSTTQTDVDVLQVLRPGYAHDRQSLIGLSGVVAAYVAAIADANDVSREELGRAQASCWASLNDVRHEPVV